MPKKVTKIPEAKRGWYWVIDENGNKLEAELAADGRWFFYGDCDDDLLYQEMYLKVVKIGPRVPEPRPAPKDSQFVDYTGF